MVCAEANHCFDSVSWVTYEEFDAAPEYAILKGYVVKKIRSTNLRMHGRDTAVIYKNGAPWTYYDWQMRNNGFHYTRLEIVSHLWEAEIVVFAGRAAPRSLSARKVSLFVTSLRKVKLPN